MLKYLIALFLIATPALAGTITVTVVTAVPPCNTGACTKTYTETDANIAKIIPTYALGCKQSNMKGTPPVQTDCTALQTMLYWVSELVTLTTEKVNRAQKQSQVDALPPITPIAPK